MCVPLRTDRISQRTTESVHSLSQVFCRQVYSRITGFSISTNFPVVSPLKNAYRPPIFRSTLTASSLIQSPITSGTVSAAHTFSMGTAICIDFSISDIVITPVYVDELRCEEGSA